MLANRFDNLSTEMLQADVQRLHEEQQEVIEALKKRLELECQIQIDHVYRIADGGRYEGRLMKVVCIRSEWDSFYPDKGIYISVHGRLNLARSSAGDGWGLRPVVVSPCRLAALGQGGDK